MIRAWLMRRHARALASLSNQRHVDHRKAVREKARAMRDAMGMPSLEILK